MVTEQSALLRAMADNYRNGHSWDELDSIACKKAADGIERQGARIAELEATVDKLLQHCPDGECSTCGEIVCPYNEPFHFHHDGCPACAEAAPSPADSGEVKP